MSRKAAAPFYQLSDSAVVAAPWLYELNGSPHGELGALLPDWDYSSRLRLQRQIRIDWTRAREELALDETFSLRLILEFGTGPGNLPREIVHVESLPLQQGSPEQLVHAELPSRRLSHQLVVRSSLVLAELGHSADRLAPREVGARLWNDRIITRLEGDDPRFPMEVVDFSTQFAGRPHRYAPWFLNWSPAGAHRDFRGAIRLYLNAAQEDIVERVQCQDPVVLQAIMSDVVSQVCEGLLQHPEADADLSETVDGTLADQARHWLERAFGSVKEARSVLDQRPGEFRAAILASMRL